MHSSVEDNSLIPTIVDEHQKAITQRLGFWPGFIHGGEEIVERVGSVDAYVNEDRWVAGCPNCNSGMACTPNLKTVCLDCGSVWSVNFPPDEDIERAEKALDKRPVMNRHWMPQTESIEDLEKENEDHGLDGS